MRSSWWVYAVVAAIAVVAGLAIAGLPDSASTGATIVAPEVTTSDFPAATTTSTTTTTSLATTTTAVNPTTTLPPTQPPATTVLPTTQPPTTPPPTTVLVTTVPLPDRAAVYVVVANGGDAAGIAGDAVADLGELGYERAFKTDGIDTADTTIVYFEDGFQGEAIRLAADVGLAADAIAPLDEAPGVVGSVGDIELLLYLGLDWA